MKHLSDTNTDLQSILLLVIVDYVKQAAASEACFWFCFMASKIFCFLMLI